MLPSPQRGQVLVVDDDPASLDMVCAHLQDVGYEPLRADSGVKALALVWERQPRVIIADWLMPRMDGVELCRNLRSQQRERLLYFIMLTVQSDKDRLMEAFEAGVDDFLTKPFHRGELLARVRAGGRLVQMYDEARTQSEALIRSNAELCRLNEKLHLSACLDELTKLPNRRQGLIRLQEHWAASLRYGQPLSCAMVDVDHFKQINDTYGHLKGDEILQKISRVLAETVRASDAVCRFGGEEFLILFPQQDIEAASTCGERCRKAVEATVRRDPAGLEPVTISVGVAQRTPAMGRYDELLSAADAALYLAKKGGRNRMSVNAAA